MERWHSKFLPSVCMYPIAHALEYIHIYAVDTVSPKGVAAPENNNNGDTLKLNSLVTYYDVNAVASSPVRNLSCVTRDNLK